MRLARLIDSSRSRRWKSRGGFGAEDGLHRAPQQDVPVSPTVTWSVPPGMATSDAAPGPGPAAPPPPPPRRRSSPTRASPPPRAPRRAPPPPPVPATARTARSCRARTRDASRSAGRRRSSSTSSSSSKQTQCGFPIETVLIATRSPPAAPASRRLLPGPARQPHVRAAERGDVPISTSTTSTPSPPPRRSIRTKPPSVSTVNGSDPRHLVLLEQVGGEDPQPVAALLRLAPVRVEDPHAEVRALRTTRARTPSDPTPRCRSQMSRTPAASVEAPAPAVEGDVVVSESVALEEASSFIRLRCRFAADA
jgi:hypothetical protein